MNTSFSRTLATALIVLGLGSGAAIAQSFGGGVPGGGGTPGSMMLQRFDTNGDGKVSEEEFRAGHAKMFETMDANNDGQLTRDELTQAAAARQANRADRMFSRMDINGDGSISREEFAAAGVSRFNARDVNGDDQLTSDELARGRAGGRGQGRGAPAQ